jgi:hypothetical protein
MNYLSLQIIIILCLISLFVSPGFSQFSIQNSDSDDDTLKLTPRIQVPEEDGDQPLKSPWGAVGRSAILPGWGQHYNENKIKPFVMFGLHAGFITAAVLEDHWAWENFDKSNDPQYSLSKQNLYRDRYEYHADRKDLFVWWAAIIYLYNLADAYVDAHLYGFDRDTKDEPHFSLITKSYNNKKFICVRY